ncbi:hypothetical protein [Methylobacterium symbioticum]|uniref:Uncharacterized protein n=1 Tax=Methylobacterium symbioticum TaxID=2584084 RepID=A0A509EIC0_9HYPH|nr:hypothetical protein [Methylobacterium symbioticum]VUD73209.1 hypothetical protein MET9862_03823 [Methylobacterium symbioticum]
MPAAIKRLRRVTLDGQLVGYWEREAARLDALAAEARFGWQRRSLERKAAYARAQGERSRAREAARGSDPILAEPSGGNSPG